MKFQAPFAVAFALCATFSISSYAKSSDAKLKDAIKNGSRVEFRNPSAFKIPYFYMWEGLLPENDANDSRSVRLQVPGIKDPLVGYLYISIDRDGPTPEALLHSTTKLTISDGSFIVPMTSYKHIWGAGRWFAFFDLVRPKTKLDNGQEVTSHLRVYFVDLKSDEVTALTDYLSKTVPTINVLP